MIRLVKNNLIDREKWEACLSTCPYDILFAHSWFLDVVCPGWHALVLNDYEAVFPLAVRSKLGVQYAYQPYFSRYFGVYGNQEGIDAAAFFEALPARIKYVDCALHESNTMSALKRFTRKNRKFQLLPLSASYDQLKKKYSVNAVRSMNKARKAGYVVKPCENPSLVARLFKSSKGMQLSEFKTRDYATLDALMHACLKRGEAKSYAVTDPGGEPVAAAFFMGSRNRFIYLKSGVTGAGRTHGAMHLLFDHFVRSMAGNDVVLDFGGSSVESVARFYRGFGASEIVYLQVTANKLGFPLALLKR